MASDDEILKNLILELRRGTIVISVLSELTEQEYGYNLVQNLSKKGFSVDPGTLYPLLRRLEAQGLLQSEWDTTESRPRKYYKITAFGKKIYEALLEEWINISKGMELFYKKEDI